MITANSSSQRPPEKKGHQTAINFIQKHKKNNRRQINKKEQQTTKTPQNDKPKTA